MKWNGAVLSILVLAGTMSLWGQGRGSRGGGNPGLQQPQSTNAQRQMTQQSNQIRMRQRTQQQNCTGDCLQQQKRTRIQQQNQVQLQQQTRTATRQGVSTQTNNPAIQTSTAAGKVSANGDQDRLRDQDRLKDQSLDQIRDQDQTRAQDKDRISTPQ